MQPLGSPIQIPTVMANKGFSILDSHYNAQQPVLSRLVVIKCDVYIKEERKQMHFASKLDLAAVCLALKPINTGQEQLE